MQYYGTDSPGWHLGYSPTDSPGWQSVDQDDLVVNLGELRLRSNGTDALRQPGFILQSLGGWFEPADLRTSTMPHRSGDGDIAGADRFDARKISIGALLHSWWDAGPNSAQDMLNSLARIRRTTLYVAERSLGRELESDVRVTQVQTTRASSQVHVVTLSLVADDPLRHSSRQLPVQTGRIANSGDQTAWPLIRVSGTDAITITHPGGTFRLTGVPSYGCLIDSRNGEVWAASGKARLHGLNSGPWPRVEPGGSDWTCFGVGTSTMARTEAWS